MLRSVKQNIDRRKQTITTISTDDGKDGGKAERKDDVGAGVSAYDYS